VIRSFRNRDTAELFAGRLSRRLPGDIQPRAYKRLLALHAAPDLRSLAAVPGNRLEALRGNRSGQHSIRINDQWRICFLWRDGDAYDAEIVDYH
jgi:proteic killer suppression protein